MARIHTCIHSPLCVANNFATFGMTIAWGDTSRRYFIHHHARMHWYTCEMACLISNLVAQVQVQFKAKLTVRKTQLETHFTAPGLLEPDLLATDVLIMGEAAPTAQQDMDRVSPFGKRKKVEAVAAPKVSPSIAFKLTF